MLDKVESSSELNLSQIDTQIKSWYATQFNLIPPLVADAELNSQDATLNKISQSKTVYLKKLQL